MSEAKYTPGPWIVDAPGMVATKAEGDDGWEICDIRTDVPERDANAHLIAAAPELLEALEYLMGIADGSGRERYIQFQLTPEFLEPARAAIAKATGESK